MGLLTLTAALAALTAIALAPLLLGGWWLLLMPLTVPLAVSLGLTAAIWLQK